MGALDVRSQPQYSGLIVDERTVLGSSTLPETLASLLKKAYDESTLPDHTDERLAAIFQLFRVIANLCMDHGKVVA